MSLFYRSVGVLFDFIRSFLVIHLFLIHFQDAVCKIVQVIDSELISHLQ